MLADSVEHHHRRRLGQLVDGDGAGGRDGHEEVLVKHAPAGEVPGGGDDDRGADEQVRAQEDGELGPVPWGAMQLLIEQEAHHEQGGGDAHDPEPAGRLALIMGVAVVRAVGGSGGVSAVVGGSGGRGAGSSQAPRVAAAVAGRGAAVASLMRVG